MDNLTGTTLGIIKLFILVALLYLVYKGLNIAMVRLRSSLEESSSRKQASDTDALVACDQCGVHVPMSELQAQGMQRICKDCQSL